MTLFKTETKDTTDRDVYTFNYTFKAIGYSVIENVTVGFKSRAEFIALKNKHGKHITFQHWIRPKAISIASAMSDYPRPNIPQMVKSLYPKELWVQETLNIYDKHNIHFIVILPMIAKEKVHKFWIGKYGDVPVKHWVLNPTNEKAYRLMLKVDLGKVPYNFVGLNELKETLDKIFENEN